MTTAQDKRLLDSEATYHHNAGFDDSRSVSGGVRTDVSLLEKPCATITAARTVRITLRRSLGPDR